MSVKILISQTASLGDVVLSTPVVNVVRKANPSAEIWFLCSQGGAELLQHHPALNGVISFDRKGRDRGLAGFLKKSGEIRSHGFSKVYAIQRSARMSMLLSIAGIRERIGFESASLPFLFTRKTTRPKAEHDVLRNLAIVAGDYPIEETDTKLSLASTAELSQEQTNILRGQQYIAIFPGSLWPTKRLNPDNFVMLAKNLRARGLNPIFFGSSSECSLVDSCAEKSGSPSLAGKTSLRQVVHAIAHAQAVVCNDSSALHISSAFEVPTLAIFCATSPAMGFGPWKNPRAVIAQEEDLWCRPCARHGGNFCPTGTNACMKGRREGQGVSAAALTQKVLSLLA